ncbi:alpha/beta hydrolase [Streptomyces sp. HC44]|uniref:Alpha/beta hydrolase n=2 Tax=Streptomyces scabichelini TaxID=2711217 RepID=A0A6G4V3V8_9ACTN|nr:alpha/beta hydrolase [Streptomyces scabichelini]
MNAGGVNAADGHPADVHLVDLGSDGWLLEETSGGPRPVPADRLDDHFAEELSPPDWATDLLVYVHGWQTRPESALMAVHRLLDLTADQYDRHQALYPQLKPWRPWTVLVRWPSRSLPSLGGYRRIRDRAHTMSADGGHAARVIGRLLGYLDTHRADPAAAPVLANRDGQYLHLIGHSFGCRFLCEAVQWAADAPATLGWSTPEPPNRPFTVDSMLLLQMAAPRDAFASRFTALAEAPLRGPVVATYSQHDRATGFWHLRAERRAGIGYAGIGTAPAPVSSISMLPPGKPYPLSTLDHRFVSVDASDVFVRGHGPAGAHSDHLHPESAHLLLSLADHSR